MYTLKPRGNPFTPRLLSLMIPLLMAAVSQQTAAVSAPSLLTSSTDKQQVFTPLAAPVDLAARAAGNSVALLELSADKGTRSMTVMFDAIRLSPGAYLQVSVQIKRSSIPISRLVFIPLKVLRGLKVA